MEKDEMIKEAIQCFHGHQSSFEPGAIGINILDNTFIGTTQELTCAT